MKVLVIGSTERVSKYLPDLPIVRESDIVVMRRGSSDEDILASAGDANVIIADAISPVSAKLIEGMPNLRLIHSEGVAYNVIDIDAARANGICVCNNAGENSGAVAEQTILLMLACLRDSIQADMSVRSGNQINAKETMMVNGIRELGDCTIGFIGFGDIARATAARLANWGCKMLYNKRTRLPKEDEESLNVSFASLEDLAKRSDIVSIHVPVTPSTEHMINAEFLSLMKEDSILINTARGEIVDQDALISALASNSIRMAGLDTIYPEPVLSDNPMLNMPEEAMRKVVFSPHIGGVTEGMFFRAHKNIWENIARLESGETLINQII